MKSYKEFDAWERLYGDHYMCSWMIVPAYRANRRNPYVRKEYL